MNPKQQRKAAMTAARSSAPELTEGLPQQANEKPVEVAKPLNQEADTQVVTPLEQETVPEALNEPEVKMPEVLAEANNTDFTSSQENVKAIEKDALISELTRDDVLSRVCPTAKVSLLGVLDYIANNKETARSRTSLLSRADYVTGAGPRMKTKLFRDIMDIITKTEDSSFYLAFGYLLQLAREEKDGEMSVQNLYLFKENMICNESELFAWDAIVRILTTLNDPMTRTQNLQKIDMNFALRYGFTDATKARLISYFNVN